MAEKQPTTSLLFFVVDPVDVTDSVREFVAALGRERVWTESPPEYVYEVDTLDATQAADEPIVTCGGALTLYRIDGDRLARLTPGVAAAQLADVEYLVKRLESLSLEAGYTIEIEYGGEGVGQIEGGHSSKGILVGLLDEWRKAL